MSTWYERNREKAIEQAKTWRLNNLDRFRQLNRESKKRKRDALKAEKRQNRPILLPFAPEGYDPLWDGDLEQWCRARNIPFDPTKW